MKKSWICVINFKTNINVIVYGMELITMESNPAGGIFAVDVAIFDIHNEPG